MSERAISSAVSRQKKAMANSNVPISNKLSSSRQGTGSAMSKARPHSAPLQRGRRAKQMQQGSDQRGSKLLAKALRGNDLNDRPSSASLGGAGAISPLQSLSESSGNGTSSANSASIGTSPMSNAMVPAFSRSAVGRSTANGLPPTGKASGQRGKMIAGTAKGRADISSGGGGAGGSGGGGRSSGIGNGNSSGGGSAGVHSGSGASGAKGLGAVVGSQTGGAAATRPSSSGGSGLSRDLSRDRAGSPYSKQQGGGAGGGATGVRPRSSGQVRTAYLANLGIDQSSQKSALTPMPNRQVASSLEHATPGSMEPLSGGAPMWWRRAFQGQQNQGSFPRSMSESAALGGKMGTPGAGMPPGKRNVRFNDMVEVRYVPLHSEYSERVRQKYWNSAQELWDMAARNSLEYAAENYDWRQAVEEQDLIRWGTQLIHPVHLSHNQFPGATLNRGQPALQGQGLSRGAPAR